MTGAGGLAVAHNRSAQAVTIACVYRSGSRLYSPRYVGVLAAMLARNVTLPYRFVCLSDVDVPCERIPLITDWAGFYSKIELFRPGLFAGPVLYLDLDTVIHGNIDALVERASEVEFGCVSDPLGGHMNSSVMAFTRDCSFVFHRFAKVGRLNRASRHHVWFTLRRIGLERRLNWGSSYGDQGFTEMCLGEAGIEIEHLDQRLPNLFSVFGYTAAARTEPQGSVCLMMGRPKPHEITHGWIKAHWRSGQDGDDVTIASSMNAPHMAAGR